MVWSNIAITSTCTSHNIARHMTLGSQHCCTGGEGTKVSLALARLNSQVLNIVFTRTFEPRHCRTTRCHHATGTDSAIICIASYKTHRPCLVIYDRMICNNLLKVALFLLLRFAQPAHQICGAGSAALYDIVTKGSPAQLQHCLRPIMFLFVFRIWPASHHRRWCEPRQQITITAL